MLTVEHVIELMSRLITWPIVVLILFLVFRRSIIEALRGGGELEAFGVKAKWFQRKITEIIKEGARDGVSAQQVAKRIAKSISMDPRELRILRGLVDEDSGRGMYSYQSSFYRPALHSLESKGYIRKKDKGFILTPDGKDFTTEYLSRVLGIKPDVE